MLGARQPAPASGSVILELSGELAVADAADLGAALSAAMDRDPVIEVDLMPRHPWGVPELPYWVMRWTV